MAKINLRFYSALIAFLTTFGLCAAQLRVISVTDLGVVSRPETVINRDGGFTVLVGGKMLWTFGDTFFNTRAEDGSAFRSNTAALAEPDMPLLLTEPVDSNGTPFPALAFTAAEQAFNDSTGSATDRIALWIGGLVPENDSTALAFYAKWHVRGALDYDFLGVGTAHFPVGSTTGMRDNGLLFSENEPVFVKAFLHEGMVYLYGGVPGDGLAQRQYLARAPLDSATQRAAYRFWNGADWDVDVDNRVSVFSGASSGVTVSYNAFLQAFTVVYSPPFSSRVLMRTAPRPEGPWSDPFELFTGMPPVPGNSFNRQGIQHPELAKNDGRTIFVSYFRPADSLRGEIRMVEVTFGMPPRAGDFTLVGLPDTQNYSGGDFGGTPEMFYAQTRWIAANRDSLNIVYVAHLGDCVQRGDNNGDASEWLVADSAMRMIEDPVATGLPQGIPYGIAVGNHDQSPNSDPNGTTTFYNRFFGEERFASRDYYGGHYGANNDNHFDLFSAGGLDFIVVYFEYDISANAQVLSWADSLLQAYPDRRAIVVSHYLVDPGPGAPWSAQGQAIYDVLKRHPNLFLMLCGHILQAENRRTDIFDGNTVYTLESNYQWRANGGDGWLRIMQFSPANNEIRIKTYSPVLDAFEVDANSQFTLPYDMTTPTSLAEMPGAIPRDLILEQNYPNPFNPATVISFQLPVSIPVKLQIYNLMGQLVRTLVDEQKLAGSYQVVWDGLNEHGERLPSGIYLYRIEAGEFRAVRRLALVK